MRVDIPTGFNADGAIQYLNQTARPFIFKGEDWLTHEQMEEWRRPFNLSDSGAEPEAVKASADDLPF